MAAKKGKTAKKILHLGHILLEFLRKVLKAMGKSDHSAETLEQGLHGGKSGLGKGGSAKSGVTASHNVETSSTNANVYEGGVTTAESTSTGSVTAGTTGTSVSGAGVSGATALVVLVIAIVTFAGLGTFIYNSEQQTIDSIKNLIWGPNLVFTWNTLGVDFTQQTEVNNSQSATGGTNSPGSNPGQNSQGDHGTGGSNIEFTVPENP